MRQAGLHATISADASPLEVALKRTESAAQAWGIRMAGIISRPMGGGGGGGGGGAGGRGQGLMQLAYLADDMQYGLRGVTNNLAQITTALGMGGGVALAATLAAIAVQKLVGGFEEIKKLSQEYEALNPGGSVGPKSEDEKGNILDFHGYLGRAKAALAQLKDLDKKVKEGAKEKEKEEAEKIKDATGAVNQQYRDQVTLINHAANLKKQAIGLSHDEMKVLRETQEVEKTRLEDLLKASYARVEAQKAIGDEAALEKLGTEQVVIATQLTRELQQLKETGVRKEADLKAQLWEKELNEDERQAEAARSRIAAEDKAVTKMNDKLLEQQKIADEGADAMAKIGREREKNLKALESSNRIQRLRDQGRDTQADREERKERIDTRAEEIARDTGVSPARARRLAEDEVGPRRGRIDARSRRKREAGGIDGTQFPGLDEIRDRGPLKLDVGASQSMRTEKGAPAESEERKLLTSIDKNISTLVSNAGNTEKSKPVPRVA